MPRIVFNPVSFAINLAIGWFFMSFLQSAARTLLRGKGGELIPRFKTIAFFHDKPAAILNIVLIVVIWVVTTSIWFKFHQK